MALNLGINNICSSLTLTDLQFPRKPVEFVTKYVNSNLMKCHCAQRRSCSHTNAHNSANKVCTMVRTKCVQWCAQWTWAIEVIACSTACHCSIPSLRSIESHLSVFLQMLQCPKHHKIRGKFTLTYAYLQPTYQTRNPNPVWESHQNTIMLVSTICYSNLHLKSGAVCSRPLTLTESFLIFLLFSQSITQIVITRG